MDIRAVKFRVGSEWRVGGLYSPSGAKSAAAVLMLHGFPGVQQNEDIAAELCRRGMAVFMPHFRGCWGSGGRFSVPGLFEDARIALRLLSHYHQVDPAHIGVLGYSVGGWVALRLASQTPVAAVAAMAPAIPRKNGSADMEYLRRKGKVINLPSHEEIWRQYQDAARADRPDAYVPRIAPAPLLFIQGLKDNLVPPASTDRLYELAGEPKQIIRFPNEGHEFQEDRPAVIAAACGWLEAQLAEITAGRVRSAEKQEEIPEYVDLGGGD